MFLMIGGLQLDWPGFLEGGRTAALIGKDFDLLGLFGRFTWSSVVTFYAIAEGV